MSKKCYECYWESENEEICDRCGKPIYEIKGGKSEAVPTQKPSSESK